MFKLLQKLVLWYTRKSQMLDEALKAPIEKMDDTEIRKLMAKWVTRNNLGSYEHVLYRISTRFQSMMAEQDIKYRQQSSKLHDVSKELSDLKKAIAKAGVTL